MAGREVVSGIVPGGAPPPGDDDGLRRLYDRALTDPGFRRRFEQAYTGPDEPLDALWWLERPQAPGPSGAPAPAALAADARRALYGPDTDPAALDAYERAAAVAERSRAAAVAALGLLPVERTAVLRDALSPASVAPASGAAPSPHRRVLVLVAAVAAAALVAGAALGFGIARAMPATTPSAPLGEHFQQTVAGHEALDVFAQPQRATDLFDGPTEALDASSYRRLVVVGAVTIFASRSLVGPGGICLTAASGGLRAATACDTPARFRAHGVVLERSDGLPDPLVRVRWQPDGKVVWWSTGG